MLIWYNLQNQLSERLTPSTNTVNKPTSLYIVIANLVIARCGNLLNKQLKSSEKEFFSQN